MNFPFPEEQSFQHTFGRCEWYGCQLPTCDMGLCMLHHKIYWELCQWYYQRAKAVPVKTKAEFNSSKIQFNEVVSIAKTGHVVILRSFGTQGGFTLHKGPAPK
jgi:hypothetical protein